MIDKKVYAGDMIDDGEIYIATTDGDRPYVPCIQIEHGLKIHLSREKFEELTREPNIINEYRLNVQDLGNNMVSVYFKHKDHLQKSRTLNGIYEERVGVNWC